MPKFTCQVCPREDPFTTLSGLAMRSHLLTVHHESMAPENMRLDREVPAHAVTPQERYLAERLQELMFPRSEDVREWPEDEAMLYRELRGESFLHAQEAVARFRYEKAAKALIHEGWSRGPAR